MLTLARRLRHDEAGNVLVTVILVSLLVGALASLALNTGEHADRASASDRNHEIALGVAEAGVHDAVVQLETRLRTEYVSSFQFTGASPEGAYNVQVTRNGDDYIVESRGTVNSAGMTERNRKIRATLRPPELFPNAGYALFSSTNLYLKNNDEVYAGDIWANDSLWVEANATIQGSITSAQSWVRLESNVIVDDGYVWAGGRYCTVETTTAPFCNDGYAIQTTSGHIDKWVKASVSAPTCGDETEHYNVNLGSTEVGEGVTLPQNASTNHPNPTRQCTLAPAAKPAPTFLFNRWNYDPATYHRFESGAAFNQWLTSGGQKTQLRGTFVIQECTPDDPADRITLNGVKIIGDVTIITNPELCPGASALTGARINTDGVEQAPGLAEKALFVVISHYRAPAGAICTDQNDTQCAIAAKNHFEPDCDIASLIYADNGPVALKNNGDACGSVIAAGIQMKNNLQLTYDPAIERTLGFCPPDQCPKTWERVLWEEIRAG